MEDCQTILLDLEETTNKVIDALIAFNTSVVVDLVVHQCACMNALKQMQLESNDLNRLSQIKEKAQLQMKMLEQGLSVSSHFLDNLYRSHTYSTTG